MSILGTAYEWEIPLTHHPVFVFAFVFVFVFVFVIFDSLHSLWIRKSTYLSCAHAVYFHNFAGVYGKSLESWKPTTNHCKTQIWTVNHCKTLRKQLNVQVFKTQYSVSFDIQIKLSFCRVGRYDSFGGEQIVSFHLKLLFEWEQNTKYKFHTFSNESDELICSV